MVHLFLSQLIKDAPSASQSPSSLNLESPSVHQSTAVVNSFEVNLFAPPEDVPFENVFAPESSNDATYSGDSNTTT